MDVILLYRQGRLSNDQSFLVQWVQNCQIAASVSARWACDHIESSYRQRRLGEEHFENKACVVFIDWSSCNFGGRHPRFRCPMPNCGRRAAILYFGTELVSLQTMLTTHLPHPAGSGLLPGYLSCAGGPQKAWWNDQFVAAATRETEGHALGNIFSSLPKARRMGRAILASLAD